MSPVTEIILLTLAICTVIGIAGAALLYALRRQSLRYQLMVVTLIPVVAVVVTVVVHVRLMFLSRHDSGVVLMALFTALVLGLIGAWLVLQRINTASREVEAGLRSLTGEPGPDPRRTGNGESLGSSTAPAELAQTMAELERTRTSLEDSRSRERAAEAARRELVSFMSHDLRTPLAGMRALVEGLEDGVVEDVPRALSHLRLTVSRMTVLVEDLFALSRVQGTPEVKPDTLVSLTELLSDVASEAGPTAGAQGVELLLDVPTEDRLAVLGSADDLSRAVANLVANAVRHTSAGSAVRVCGRRAADGHLLIEVLDSCGGIPEDNLPRVFDTGWRGTRSRASGEEGAGLGLAIARGVVESHAGRIGVRNTGPGCSFQVDLPATDVVART
jgi:signal transduction histidine kinase